MSAQPERKRLRLAHEEIVGFMEAMTMELDVVAASEIAALQPGDLITATLRVTDARTELTAITKVGHTAPPKEAAQLGVPQPGAEFPDAALIDDTGKPFRIADHRGKAIALTFIYTRCPLPDFCPRMNSHFAATMHELPDERCLWLSVTIDPTNDTPQLLAEFAKQFTARGERWKFATGPAEEVSRLATFAGLEIRAAGAQLDHNLRTLVIAPDGKVSKVFTGNQWQPSELAAEMKRVVR